jgi:hypothetical protein
LLRYFRINDPYRLLGLLTIMVLMYLPLFIDPPPVTYPELKSILVGEKVHEGLDLYTELVDSTGPFAGWFEAFTDMIFGRSLLARHITAFFIIFLQAIFLGIVFIDKKVFPESSFVPSVLFVLLFFFSFDNYALSPELIGSGFLLLALNYLFKEIEFREQRDESVFNIGLFISLGSLFEFSFVVYLAGALIILTIFTRNSARKFLLLIVGFLLPHLLLLSIYFLKDGLQEMWQYYYIPNLGFASSSFITTKGVLILGIVPLFYLVVSFIMLNREGRFTKYQSQLIQAMFFWLVFSVLQILYSKNFRPQSFITLIPGFSFFITYFLLMIRRKRLAEINFWTLLIGIVTVAYLGRYNKLASVSYADLIVKESQLAQVARGKKVLVLTDDLSVYKNNTFSSFFLNWNLSREILEQPDYYDHVIKVHEAFRRDAPDVIIDPHDLMKKFFEKIPALRSQYRAAPEGYVRISS